VDIWIPPCPAMLQAIAMVVTAVLLLMGMDHSVIFAGWRPYVAHLIHGSFSPHKSDPPTGISILNLFSHFCPAHYLNIQADHTT